MNQYINEEQIECFHYEPQLQEHKQGRKRVAAYCRVSTLAEEQDLSFETQCGYYEKLIAGNSDIELVGIYGDQGFSGLEASHRKEFQRMLADCEAGKIDLILVKSISRFSRNTVDCIEYLKRLKEKGIAVLFEKEGLNSMDPQTEMILSIYASMAQSESCSHSENIRWARKRHDEIGDPVRMAPFGYRRVKDDGRSRKQWVIYEPEAKKVRLLFRMAYQGYSTTEIREALDQMEKEEGSAYVWKKWRVVDIMKNEAYRGDILTNKTVTLDYLHRKTIRNHGQVEQYYIEQHHEPIIDPEIFDTVQEYLKGGFLLQTYRLKREAWFAEHPEILKRRENISD